MSDSTCWRHSTITRRISAYCGSIWAVDANDARIVGSTSAAFSLSITVSSANAVPAAESAFPASVFSYFTSPQCMIRFRL